MARVQLMWNAVAAMPRRWVFRIGDRWLHDTPPIASAAQLYKFIEEHGADEVHLRAVGAAEREWVLDVDTEGGVDGERVTLKNNVALRTLVRFFGVDHVHGVYFSGNRGAHVWLDGRAFPPNADKELRRRYFGVFQYSGAPPPHRPHTFMHAFHETVREPDILQRIGELYERPPAPRELFPKIDEHVFVHTTTAIRCPYSFNVKGGRFSERIDHRSLSTDCTVVSPK